MTSAHVQIGETGDPPFSVPFNPRALAGVCRAYDVRWLAVFGSRARGKGRADSDLDVVVEFERGKTPGFGFIRLQHELGTLFGGLRVDLHTRDSLPATSRSTILAEARTLFG
jgi:predicted nucleotidyltransferase